MQIVSQLELQLKKEKDRLNAMMKHLHLESRNGELKEISPPSSPPGREDTPPRRPTPPSSELSRLQQAFPGLSPSLAGLVSTPMSLNSSPLSALVAVKLPRK